MKDIKEPLIILLVLFVLIGLAYGPLKKASLNKSLSPSNTTSSITASPNSGYSSNKSTEESIKSVAENVKTLQEDVSKEIDKSKRSPYYGKIRMSSISGLYQTDPNEEYLSFYTNIGKNETVKITGWYFKSEITGYFAVIGKAALLPYPFTNTETDVILQQGDRVYLTKGFSPIGISFRTNKCTGYFEENRSFYPGLPLQCPQAQYEKLPKFSSDYDSNDECVKTLQRIPQCTTVDSKFIRDLPDTISPSCKDYMTNQINYNTCVAVHFGDVDFPGDEYHLYLNKFGSLWRPMHDKIDLIDENGLIVDSVSY
jgi:hypothetical protein